MCAVLLPRTGWALMALISLLSGAPNRQCYRARNAYTIHAPVSSKHAHMRRRPLPPAAGPVRCARASLLHVPHANPTGRLPHAQATAVRRRCGRAALQAMARVGTARRPRRERPSRSTHGATRRRTSHSPGTRARLPESASRVCNCVQAAGRRSSVPTDERESESARERVRATESDRERQSESTRAREHESARERESERARE